MQHALRLFAVVAFVLIGARVEGCLQHIDSLQLERSWQREQVQIVTGRFIRYPALYYEMRIARIVSELEHDPTQLSLYDDAAVATELLGRSDQAIEWMQRKWQQLQTASGTEREEHLFRYKANLGTFLAHRWVTRGANRGAMEDLLAARTLITEAIAMRPNAHFGRERYQLKAIEWLISPPAAATSMKVVPDFLGLVAGTELPTGSRYDQTAINQHPDAKEGLLGLIALGAGWHSVDVLNALSRYLDATGDAENAALVRYRIEEVVRAGGRSLYPDAPRGRSVLGMVGSPVRSRELRHALPGIYREMRWQADTWLAHRWAYMMPRLKAGLHPDTDTDFWSEYREPTPQDLEPHWLRSAWYRHPTLFVFSGLGGLLGLGFLAQRLRPSVGRREPKPSGTSGKMVTAGRAQQTRSPQPTSSRSGTTPRGR
jgi:hypothetical protein